MIILEISINFYRDQFKSIKKKSIFLKFCYFILFPFKIYLSIISFLDMFREDFIVDLKTIN